MAKVLVYDTTLRDGNQAEGIAFSVEDKLLVAHRLDEMGFDYIECGWPNETNPRDREVFQRARNEQWQHAKIAAFGSTRRPGIAAEDDSQLRDLVDAGAPVITIFGKSWDLHVTEVLRTSLAENLAMIEDSVAFLKSTGAEVIFDAEHFFDGYRANPEYALETLRAAERGGAECLVLCDTNGGSMPGFLQEAIAAVRQTCATPLGIHCHNDSGMAVANTQLAVEAGAVQVQGTINGYGERCGNANLCTIIPNLELKAGLQCLPEGKLHDLLSLARYVDEVALMVPDTRAPYVGASAFAHKGGMHVNAVLKVPSSFEHVDPEVVGNERRILVSDYSGGSTIMHKLEHLYPDLDRKDPRIREVLAALKDREKQGYHYEAAEASFELLARRVMGEDPRFFELHGFRVIMGKHAEDEDPFAEATVQVEIDGDRRHTAAMGDGPVNALDQALREALQDHYPEIAKMRLVDYKVRVLNATEGTSAAVQTLIQTRNNGRTWGTVGVHVNIIEASWQALTDSIVYGILSERGPAGGGA
ncbi:MAG TPA: citramalate synthase [Armatimonadota bacterium]|nr:citramalate synthase [Armatimonadota bacterium]